MCELPLSEEKKAFPENKWVSVSVACRLNVQYIGYFHRPLHTAVYSVSRPLCSALDLFHPAQCNSQSVHCFGEHDMSIIISPAQLQFCCVPVVECTHRSLLHNEICYLFCCSLLLPCVQLYSITMWWHVSAVRLMSSITVQLLWHYMWETSAPGFKKQSLHCTPVRLLQPSRIVWKQMIKLDTAESDMLPFSSFSKPRADITQHATKPLSDIIEDRLSDHEPLPMEPRKVLHYLFFPHMHWHSPRPVNTLVYCVQLVELPFMSQFPFRQ